MRGIRVRRTVESQVLDLPELADLIGRTVDIIILDEGPSENGRVDLAALDEIAGKDLIDDAAIWDFRRASMT